MKYTALLGTALVVAVVVAIIFRMPKVRAFVVGS